MSTATRKKSITGEYVRVSSYIRNGDENLKFAIVLIGVIFISAIAYFAMAAGWPKFSRAEVFFAECVREMIQTDNLVTPLYHGAPFFDKPVLCYWFILCAYKLFGVSHLAARVPSIVAALGTIGLTSFGTHKLFGPRAGTLAGAVLASSFMFLSFSNMCMSDMTLVFFDTATLCLLYAATFFARRAHECRNQSLADQPSRQCQPAANPAEALSTEGGAQLQGDAITKSNILFWIAALSAGLAFLTKGPVGIALPGLLYVMYLTFSKQWNVIRFFSHVVPSLSIMILVTVPWFFAAFRENGAGALTYFFFRENLQRFAGATYDTHRPVWFMVTSLLSGSLPWSVFLPFALKRSTAEWKNGVSSPEGQKHLFLWLWVAIVVGFFSISRGKIDYYALPAYPATAALIGLYLSEIADKKTAFAKIAVSALGLVFVIAGIAAAVVFPIATGLTQPSQWLLTPTMLLSGGAGILWCCMHEQLRKSFKLVFVTIAMTAVAFSVQMFPWITASQAILAFMPAITQSDQSTRIGLHCDVQNWIDEVLFQTGRESTPLRNTDMAARMIMSPAPALVLIPEKEFYRMPDAVRAHARILDSKPFIARSINPGFLFSSMGKLSDQHLLLIANASLSARSNGSR